MKVLDSDLLIALLKRVPDAERKIAELQSMGELLATTSLSADEVLTGTIQSGLGSHRYRSAQLLLRSLPSLVYDFEAVEKTIGIRAALAERGELIGTFDEMISGICLLHGATIVTRNVEHFGRVRGLHVETW